MAKSAKTVIIGLDGVPFGMLKDFAETGVMPHTAELISQGVFRKMNSSLPEVSSVAWSSVITGRNPAEHGIFGFMDLFAGSYKMRFPNFNSLKIPPFWEQLDEESVIINVPSTYPVHPMNGVHISGFVSVDFERSVYPKSLIPLLKSMDYRLDVDSQKAHSSMELFLSDLDKTLEARISSYRYLWDHYSWQTFMLVFTGTDRLMHFLFDAYEDKTHKYHDYFLNHFRRIDTVIGEVCSRLGKNDTLIMLSDHGFERLDYDIYINYLLASQGLLRFRAGRNIALNNIDYGTQAFSLEPARIYLNFKDKFPCGTVEKAQAPELLSRLEELFRSLRVDGRMVIRDVYRKEQIYHGPYLNDAPDMVLVGAEGFNLKSNVKAGHLSDKAVFTGKHTQDDAFLLINNEIIVPEKPAVWDVKSIIEKNKAGLN